MTILLNGQHKTVGNISNLEELIRSVVDKDAGLIVEMNEKIIKREQWPHHIVQEGDVIELIRLVGGG